MTSPTQTTDAERLFETLLRSNWFGQVTDANTPQGATATLECIDGDAVITTDVLVGPQGDPGEDATILNMQYPPVASEGAINITGLGPADKGKAWWIDGQPLIYIWTGTQLQAAQPGPAGPTGASPVIAPTTSVIPLADRVGPDAQGNDIDSNVQVTNGDSLTPQFHYNLAAPVGPAGPSVNIMGAPDYDPSVAPLNGQTLTWNSVTHKWAPSDFASKHPLLYSIPEAAFTNFTGLAQRQPIASFQMPPISYDWIPWVSGHIKAAGLELNADPLTIGVEVRINDATTGPLVGRGFGNISNWAVIDPHFSTSADPNTAVSPGNNVAVVPAGVQTSIYVNLYNDGLLGAYIFNNAGAQLSILAMPAEVA